MKSLWMKTRRWIGLAIAASGVAVIYRHWFRPGLLTGGDWGFHFPETMLDWWPGWQLWDSGLNFGRILDQFFLQFSLYGWMTKTFGVTYAISERVIWFGPLLVLLVVGMFGFTFAMTKRTLAATVATLVWALNSYVLLLTVGGQISVAVSVAAIPLTLWALLIVLERGQWWQSVLLGFALTLQSIYDIRITYATVAVIVFLIVVHCWFHRSMGWKIIVINIKRVFPGFLLFFLLQLYWLLPWMMGGGVNIAALGGQSDWVNRLSFFRLEYILSATHPLWPMRQLGAVSALDRITVFNSVIFFVGLLWTTRLRGFERLFLLTVWLYGAFFLLGGLPPAGPLYLWFFDHVPAFNMFRDPSKFFGFVAIPFSVLVGWVAVELHRQWLKPSRVVRAILQEEEISPAVRKIGQWTVPILIVLFFVVQAGPGLLRDAGGTFQSRAVPPEYLKTADHLRADSSVWTRVLWAPMRHRFAFYTHTRPALDLNEVAPRFESWVANEPAPLTTCTSYTQLLNPFVTRLMGAGMLVVPVDSDKEQINPHEGCRRDLLKNVLGRFAAYRGFGNALPVNLYRQEKRLDWIYPSGGAMTSEPDPSLAENFELLPLAAVDAPTWFPHVKGSAADTPPRYHDVNRLKQERRKQEEAGNDPKLVKFTMEGINRQDIPSEVPLTTVIKVDGVDAEHIAMADGWLAPSGKLDHRGAEYPDAIVTYRLDVPKSGIYTLAVQLRRDPRRSVIQYAFDAPLDFSEALTPFLRQIQKHWAGGDRQKEFMLSGEDDVAYTERIEETLRQPIAWQGALEPTIPDRTFRYELFSMGTVKWQAGTHTVTLWSHADGAQQDATIDYLLAVPQEVETRSLPTVAWERKSATKVTALVKGASEPFFLNFLEEYHPGWEATINGEVVATHLPANVYAQAWWITERGDYTVELFYHPQVWFDRGRWIAIVALGISLVALGVQGAWVFIKRKQ
jgi:hypothetical protein